MIAHCLSTFDSASHEWWQAKQTRERDDFAPEKHFAQLLTVQCCALLQCFMATVKMLRGYSFSKEILMELTADGGASSSLDSEGKTSREGRGWGGISHLLLCLSTLCSNS